MAYRDESAAITHLVDQLPDPGALKYQFRSVRELLTAPRPRWMIRDLLPEQGVSVVFGAPGSGKTFFVLDESFALARGEPFFGRRTKARSVLYVAAEGTLRLRIEAYLMHNDLASDDLVNFRALESGINLLDHSGLELNHLIAGLGEAIKHMKEDLGLVVIDTLNRAFPGMRENAAEDMGLAIKAADTIARTFGCVVQYIHHSGKDTEKGARGHSSLLGAVDAQVEITRVNDDVRVANASKIKDGKEGVLGAFVLVPVDLGSVAVDDPDAEEDERYWSCVIEATDVPDPVQTPRDLTPRQRMVMSHIHTTFTRFSVLPPAALRNKNIHPDGPIEGQYVIQRRDFWTVFQADYRTPSDGDWRTLGEDERDTLLRVARRTIGQLVKRGEIRIFQDWIWLAVKK